jgi:hypothetical protein
MRAQVSFRSVHLFDGREPSDYLVIGTLDDLEEVDKDRQVFVEVRVSARLTDLRTGDVLWSDTSSETTKPEDHAVPDLVAAMSQTAESVVTRLISSMQYQLSRASASLVRTQPGQP